MSSPSSPSSPPLEYCFHIPQIPYTKNAPVGQSQPLDPNHPTICYSGANLSSSHLQTVKDICSVYGACDNIICKNYLGHAVMCPDIDHYTSGCLYDWAKKGLNTPEEQMFIRVGKQFIAPNKIPFTVAECRLADMR